MSDSMLLDEEPNSPATQIENPVDDAAASGDSAPIDGTACEVCGAALGDSAVSFCKSCGYYPSMKTFVEVDPWEKRLADGTGDEEAAPKSHVQILIELVPVWGWWLIGLNLAVVVMSVAVRLLSPAVGNFRMIWSILQLATGFIAFFVCHSLAYMAAVEDDADIGMLDYVLRPIRIWTPTLRKLPATLRQTAIGSCGLNAAMMSLLVIGALPYHVLLDWGIKEPPKTNLMDAIIAQANEAEGNEDGLEDAIDGFAGGGPAQAEDTNKALRPADCLIIGFMTNKDNDAVASLILAREAYGDLVIAGRVAVELGDEENHQLLEDLRKIQRVRPFVNTTYTAFWVQPKFTCRVKYEEENSTGKLSKMQFDRMLGTIDR